MSTGPTQGNGMNPQTPMVNDPNYTGHGNGTGLGNYTGYGNGTMAPPGHDMVPSRPMPGQRMMAPGQMAGYPMAGGAPQSAMPNAAAVDVIGPIMRRKFLVAFLALIGAGVGYFAYTGADIIYESSARLMISSQAPPVVVDGERFAQRVSIAKHEKLVSSQLVLERAVRQGKLGQLAMFKDQSDDQVMEKLRSSVLTILTSKNKDDDTLVVSAKGKIATELPVILNFVVESYRDEIAKDSKTTGQESGELFTKLHDQLEREKSEAQKAYVEILTRLDMPNIEQGNVLVNPFNEELSRITTLRNAALIELRDVESRLDLAGEAVASNEDAQITYLVTAAKRFLGSEVETVETLEAKRAFNYEYSRQIFALERDLNELMLRRDALARSLGKNHPLLTDLNRRISHTSGALATAKNQQAQQDKEFSNDDQDTGSLEEKLEQRNRKWIAVYQTALQTERQRLTQKLTQLEEELQLVESQARAVAADFLQLNVLKNRVAEKQREIGDVLTRLSQINVVANNFTVTKVNLIDMPGEGVRIAPSLIKYLGIGVFIGGLLGVGLAVLIDRSDMTYRNPGEIFDRLKVPVIARIPGVRISNKGTSGAGNPAMATLYKPTSKMAEAIRAARTSVLFSAQTTNSKVFLFTSPSPGDGKSTTTANLAISLAQAGKKVALVDSDFRRPRVHVYFEQEIEPGILQATAGVQNLSDCLRTTSQEGLYLLTAGGRPKNPGEVVTGESFARLIQDLRSQFDIVLIDSPPLLPVADAAVISSLVDGVYLVIRIRKGVVVTSSKAKEKLDMVNANLLGVIVNGVDDNPHYNEYGSYGYGYGYGYGGSTYGNGSYYESRNSRYQEKITSRD